MSTEEILKEYPLQSNEEYLKNIEEKLSKIDNNQILRHFYIFISEKLK